MNPIGGSMSSTMLPMYGSRSFKSLVTYLSGYQVGCSRSLFWICLAPIRQRRVSCTLSTESLTLTVTLRSSRRKALVTKYWRRSIHLSGDYAIDRGLEKLREGRQAIRSVARKCEEGHADEEEDHQLLRNAIKTFRSATNWLEDSEHFESAHVALDEAGRLARELFPEGCTLAYRDNTYYIECPAALAHNRVGMSPGMVINSAECSICGSHPQDCIHITGRIYDGKRCVRILKDLEFLEISLVGRPRQPEARIESMSVDTAELQASLG